MATRRRKIARSAVRRVKRRASKSVKLRSLRYRKNSSKRMMTHRGGEGRDPGFEGLDKEKVFRTYCMIVEDDKSTFYYPIRSIFCILMYNHSSKHFHLFINEGGSQKKTIELIKGLCGIEIENPEILRWPLWCKYYYRFADDKLYSVQVASSSGPVNKSDITETEIKPASKSEVPALALRRARRRFVDFEWMRDGEVAGDVIEVYEQIELYPYLQPKPATFTSNKFDRVLYNFKLAINAKASCLAYDMPDYLEERKKESTKKIEEKWIETEKSLDFDVQAELRPYVPSPALFNMRRGLRTLIKMREFLEAHNYSPLVQKNEVSERTDWAVELQRKIALTVRLPASIV